ncbi:MAG TPA: hypothetical protein VLI92_02310 [Candidatus Saccharimonadales bacterium]|nr:hypothetical protein [Candidatus Saccharimonadales bacterium]
MRRDLGAVLCMFGCIFAFLGIMFPTAADLSSEEISNPELATPLLIFIGISFAMVLIGLLFFGWVGLEEWLEQECLRKIVEAENEKTRQFYAKLYDQGRLPGSPLYYKKRARTISAILKTKKRLSM